MSSLGKIKEHSLENTHIRSRSRSQYELDRLTSFGDDHMNPQSIEIAALAGDSSSVTFGTIDPAPADPVVIADRDRKAIHHVFLSVIGSLVQLRKQSKQTLPNTLVN